jgi:hypothetical protein
MTVRERERLPDLDAEREVDLGRAAATIAARWWLLLLGLMAGLFVGYALSLGGSKVYRATALVYPGTPLAAGGGQLPNLLGTPTAIRQLVSAEANVRRAASASGLRPAQVRSGTSVQQQAAAAGARTTGSPFVTISVKGPAPRRVRIATNELARIVVRDLSPFVDQKITTLAAALQADEQALSSVARTIDTYTRILERTGLSETDRLVAATTLSTLESRRATLKSDIVNEQQLLAQARSYEKPSIVARAVPRETTARSRRNSLLVGGAIGLLLGLVAALAWDPVAERMRRNA